MTTARLRPNRAAGPAIAGTGMKAELARCLAAVPTAIGTPVRAGSATSMLSMTLPGDRRRFCATDLQKARASTTAQRHAASPRSNYVVGNGDLYGGARGTTR